MLAKLFARMYDMNLKTTFDPLMLEDMFIDKIIEQAKRERTI